ncbi:MAG: hypothetical protein ACE5JR_12615 [Gemmatimonadota bacterium]
MPARTIWSSATSPSGGVEPGKLRLEHFGGGKGRPYGPLPVPSASTELLREGWDISCALGRVPGRRRILEVADVQP